MDVVKARLNIEKLQFLGCFKSRPKSSSFSYFKRTISHLLHSETLNLRVCFWFLIHPVFLRI